MNIKKIADDQNLKDTLEIIRLASKAKNITDLSVGQPDFNPPKGILKQDSAKYGPAEGYKELRELLSKKLKKENKITTTSENIIVTSGSLEALNLVLLATASEGDEVLIPNPGFITYIDSVYLSGAKPVYYYFTKDCKIDIKYLKRKLTKKTKAIILNSPGNPLGNVFSKEEINDLVKILKNKKIWIISDEAYEKYVYGKPHISIGSILKGKVITLGSFSKTYGIPGWRIGYLDAPISLISILKNLKLAITICTTTSSQLAAIRLLSKGNSLIQKSIKTYNKRRKLMIGLLEDNKIKYIHPEGSFFIWIDLRYLKKKSMTIFKELLKKRLLVMPGNIFGSKGEGYIRLSYAKNENTIKNGIKILKEYLN